uniref:Uncharacterized protein n=1 Tax=Arundo donax TaxID=35708 RepID=A0A0A9M195_ARUDO
MTAAIFVIGYKLIPICSYSMRVYRELLFECMC